MKAPAAVPASSADAPRIPQERAALMAEMLRALGHPVRLQIVALLCEADCNVNSMAEQLEVSQPIVSQQLRILRMMGLVDASREGGFARYHLARPELRSLVRCLHRCCEG